MDTIANEDQPHVVLVDDNLYGYGVSLQAARVDFQRQIAGGTSGQRWYMKSRSRIVAVSADHASEVAEMLSAEVTDWS